MSVFVFVSVFGSLLLPRTAEAQIVENPVSDPVITTQLPIIAEAVGALQAKYAAKDVEMKLQEVLLLAAYMAITQAIQSFVTRLAYDSAVYLAAGGKGEHPFAHYKNFGDYMADVGNDAAGSFLQGFGDILGVDLCAPPTLMLDLALRLGLKGKYFPEKPRCTLTQFLNNWKQVGSSRYWTNMASNFNFSIKPDQSDLGIYLDSTVKVDQAVKEKTYGAEKQRSEGQGAIGMSDIISGNIKTPAQVMQTEFKNNSASEKAKSNVSTINASMASGMKDLLYYVPAVFLNTFLSQTLNNFMTKGMLFGYCVSGQCDEGGDYTWPVMPEIDLNGNIISNNDIQNDNTNDDNLNDPDTTVVTGRAVAEAMFRDLLTAPINSIDEYNIINFFSSCPANPGPDNCIMDYALASALQEYNSTGKYLTIKEALDRDLLHKKFKLIPPTNSADVESNCYQSNYCYSNIKKMRQTRILPLGFEIAAKNSNPDAPWALEDVVNGFYDCTYRDGKAIYDAKKPFCHLINPNWVLKVPQHRCNAFVYGVDIAVAGSGQRAQECVDLQGCVGSSLDGKSCQSYGYCLKEKNIWQFDADKCEEQYASCVSFKDTTGQQVGYLYRTLDSGDCNAENTGCLAYSLSKDNDGNWLAPSAPKDDDDNNTGIHFNGTVSTDCSSGSAGCSAYKLASASSTILYLRKAPDYLGCYNANTTLPVVWPNTVSDLNFISSNLSQWKKDECKKYSAPCIAAEENCNMYTQSTTGEAIPGKFNPAEVAGGLVLNWYDQCDAKCVGYAAYKEMPSNYSNGKTLDYIIPSSGSTCSAVDEGCSAFTNLSTLSGQMEKVEYFSYLRPCITPSQAPNNKYFTYEGSQAEGYQLKVYVLQKDVGATSDSEGIVDGPQYFYRTSEDLANFRKACNAEVYRQGSSHPDWNNALSPDCRQFTDDKGHTYYRILSQTIPVSLTCTPYRLNNTELQTVDIASEQLCTAAKGYWDGSACGLCFNNGEYKDGFCFYYGLAAGENNTAGVSRVCSAAVDTCRAYKGNAGNNIKNIFYDQFEQSVGDTLVGWSAINGTLALSLESTKAGEHSLNFAFSGSASVNKVLSLVPGKSYDLTFWAKGSGAVGGNINVEAKLVNKDGGLDNPQSVGVVTLGDSWRYYHLGPIELGGTTTSTELIFALANGRIYLDNIKLVEVTDYIYLVKKSLTVDPICDSSPNDNLPGEALGCLQYDTPNNLAYYLTNFSYLCREEAVGCTKVIDTFNTIADAGVSYYNVWLPADGTGGQMSIILSGKKFSCQSEVGKTGCYTNVFGHTRSEILAASVFKGNVDTGALPKTSTSTIHVPSDSAPVYLVANSQATCAAADLGCAEAGRQKLTATGASYQEVLIKNDPAGYFGASNVAGTLCTSQGVGCSSYNSSKGNMYFKDPKIVGNKICTWKTRVEKDPYGATYGWFWKNVGRCSQGGADDLCYTDSDCATTGGECIEEGEQPCYPDYFVDYQKFDLWSYGTPLKYQGFVGECPIAQNGCTEFVDKNDCQTGDACQSYYLIYNDKLTASVSECNGQASLSQGCALLDQTDQVNKYWNTAVTYALSNGTNGAKVAPVDQAPNDANIIVKAQHDRACSEWVYCRLAQYTYNIQTGKQDSRCYALGVCDKFLSSSGDNKCAHDVTIARQKEVASGKEGAIITDRALVTSKPQINYLERNINWGGEEYSGYSMFTYNTNDLHEQIPEVNLNTISTTTDFSCRMYPEVDSPFPLTVFKNQADEKEGYVGDFGRVKLCDDKSNGGKGCECSYYKLTYSADSSNDGRNLYLPLGKSAPEYLYSQTSTVGLGVPNEEDENKTFYSFTKYYYNSGSGSKILQDGASKLLAFPRSLYIDFNKNTESHNESSCVLYGLAAYDSNNPEERDFDSYYYDPVKMGLTQSCETVLASYKTGAGSYGGGSFNNPGLNGEIIPVFFKELYIRPSLVGRWQPLKTKNEVNGLKGYCLERDFRRLIDGTGRNGIDPEYACLSWLPVYDPKGVNSGATEYSNDKGAWNYSTDSLAPPNIGFTGPNYMCLNTIPIPNTYFSSDYLKSFSIPALGSLFNTIPLNLLDHSSSNASWKFYPQSSKNDFEKTAEHDETKIKFIKENSQFEFADIDGNMKIIAHGLISPESINGIVYKGLSQINFDSSNVFKKDEINKIRVFLVPESVNINDDPISFPLLPAVISFDANASNFQSFVNAENNEHDVIGTRCSSSDWEDDGSCLIKNDYKAEYRSQFFRQVKPSVCNIDIDYNKASGKFYGCGAGEVPSCCSFPCLETKISQFTFPPNGCINNNQIATKSISRIVGDQIIVCEKFVFASGWSVDDDLPYYDPEPFNLFNLLYLSPTPDISIVNPFLPSNPVVSGFKIRKTGCVKMGSVSPPENIGDDPWVACDSDAIKYCNTEFPLISKNNFTIAKDCAECSPTEPGGESPSCKKLMVENQCANSSLNLINWGWSGVVHSLPVEQHTNTLRYSDVLIKRGVDSNNKFYTFNATNKKNKIISWPLASASDGPAFSDFIGKDGFFAGENNKYLDDADMKAYYRSNFSGVNDYATTQVQLMWSNDSNLELQGLSIERSSEQSEKLGYFVVVELKNPLAEGPCGKIAKVSYNNSLNNPNNFLPVTWKMRTSSAHLGVPNTPADIIVLNQNWQTPFQHFGLFDRSITEARLKAGGDFLNDMSLYPQYVGTSENRNLLLSGKLAKTILRDEEVDDDYHKGGVPVVFNKLEKKYSGFVDVVSPDTNGCGSYDPKDGFDPEKASCLVMNNLFLRSFGFFKIDYDETFSGHEEKSKFTYISYESYFDGAAPSHSDFTHYPPLVAAPELDQASYGSNLDDYTKCRDTKGGDGTCKIAALGAVSINNKIRGDAVARAGDEVKIRFFAWAHSNQMPLKRIRINFMDTFYPITDTRNEVNYEDDLANIKPNCDTGNSCTVLPELGCKDGNSCKIGNSIYGNCTSYNSESKFFGFGNTTETGCQPEYTEFSYVYECPLPTATNFYDLPENMRFPQGPYAVMKVGADKSKPYEIEIAEEHTGFFLSTGDIVCAYQPRAQVVDNWGWCNGDCHKTTASTPARGTETGCYNWPVNPNTGVATGVSECDSYFYSNTAGKKAYTEFNGHVIVIPSEKY